MRSIVCNPTKSECNQHEVLDVIIFARKMYVINPKKKTYKSCDLMTYRLHRKRITYA